MRDARLKKLTPTCPPLAASLVVIPHTCGNKKCRCYKSDQNKHKGNYITFKQDAKTKTVYVPLDLLKDVQQSITEHKRIKQLLKEISQLNVALIRTHVKHKKRRSKD